MKNPFGIDREALEAMQAKAELEQASLYLILLYLCQHSFRFDEALESYPGLNRSYKIIEDRFLELVHGNSSMLFNVNAEGGESND